MLQINKDILNLITGMYYQGHRVFPSCNLFVSSLPNGYSCIGIKIVGYKITMDELTKAVPCAKFVLKYEQ